MAIRLADNGEKTSHQNLWAGRKYKPSFTG